MSSRNATKYDFEIVIQSIKNNEVNPIDMVTHSLAFNQVVSDFSLLTQPDQAVIKALINFD